MKLSRIASAAAICAAVVTTGAVAAPARAHAQITFFVPSIVMTGTFGPGILGVNSGGLTVPYECVAVAEGPDPDGSLTDLVQSTVVDSCYLTPVNSTATGASQPRQRTDGPGSAAVGVANNVTVLGFNLCWSGHIEYQHDSSPETFGCAAPILGPGIIATGLGSSSA